MKYLPLLWAGLFRKKTRTLLTLASIVIAFLLFGLLQAVQAAFEAGADAADAKRLLTISRYSFIELLPIAHLKQIERVPGVVGVSYAEWFGAKYQNESNAVSRLRGGSRALPGDVPGVHHRARAARGLRARRAPARWPACALVERFGWKIGQTLPISRRSTPRPTAT